MNKRSMIFVIFLFLYLFCTIDSISLTEKGFNINSMEQHEKIYENPHKPHENQDKPTTKLKKPTKLKKIRKKNKISKGSSKIINISETNIKESKFNH